MFCGNDLLHGREESGRSGRSNCHPGIGLLHFSSIRRRGSHGIRNSFCTRCTMSKTEDLEMESDAMMKKETNGKGTPAPKNTHYWVVLILVIIIMFMFLILVFFTILQFIQYGNLTEEQAQLMNDVSNLSSLLEHLKETVTNLILLQDDLIYQQKMFSRKQLIFSYELKKFDSKLEVERKKTDRFSTNLENLKQGTNIRCKDEDPHTSRSLFDVMIRTSCSILDIRCNEDPHASCSILDIRCNDEDPRASCSILDIRYIRCNDEDPLASCSILDIRCNDEDPRASCSILDIRCNDEDPRATCSILDIRCNDEDPHTSSSLLHERDNNQVPRFSISLIDVSSNDEEPHTHCFDGGTCRPFCTMYCRAAVFPTEIFWSSITGSLSNDIQRISGVVGKLADGIRKEHGPSTPLCETHWVHYGLNCYYKSWNAESWENARKNCQHNMSDLVVINGEDEMNFLYHFSEQEVTWIGLAEKSGTWKWVDDTSYEMTPTHWQYGGPYTWPASDLKGKDECAYLVNEHSWSHDNCSLKFMYICENKRVLL
ncbi:uncharacterized protein [Aquarana catesbeiana]|uniref:uncharacterized protein n=1 Tax=Aquarana catesbeiana TaxID=8400 RepID=UPI003CC9BFF6